MSANTRIFYVDDSYDSSPAIARSDSREIVLINEGPNRVFFGFNGAISTDSVTGCYGVHIDAGQYIVLTGLKCDSDIYMRCNTGEEAVVMGEIK